MSSSKTRPPTKKAASSGKQGKPQYLPPVFKEIFDACQFKVYWGGRGSAKSWTVATALVLLAAKARGIDQKAAKPTGLRIVCAREFQNSISDSVHKLLSDVIARLGLQQYFKITRDAIIAYPGTSYSSEFMFKGLRHNPDAIKSLEGADICWVEEAQHVSRESWDTLLPTIRKKGSQVWITFNPDAATDPTYQEFVINADPGWIVRRVNYTENPYFGKELQALMERAKKNDYEAYLHIWEGNPKTVSDAVIFKGKFVCEGFETPDDAMFYYGADWGFSPDPLVAVRCFIKDDTLYVDQEVYGLEVDLTDVPKFIASLPGATQWPMRADSSQPGMIAHCQKNGLPLMRAAKKPAGSVEDGIAFMRGMKKIVIHPRCKRTYEEFKLYSKKVDKGGNVLPIIVDKHNHVIDSIRYALEPEITSKHTVKRARISGF